MTETPACGLCGAEDATIVYAHASGSVASVVCPRCGLAYLSPRPDATAAAKFYRGYQQSYPDEFLCPADSPPSVAARERARFARSWLEPGSSVIEVGCGYGHFLRELDGADLSVSGLEPSEPQVAFARETFGLEQVRSGTIEDLPCDESADLVAMFHVIEHLRDPFDALRRVAATLKTGGRVFLDLPNALRLPTDAIEHFYVISGQHLYSFTPRVVEALLTRAGLEPVYVAHEPLPAVYPSNLRVVARKTANAPEPKNGDAYESLECMRRYHRDLLRLGEQVARRLTEWQKNQRLVAVYGAGFHTQGLIDLCGIKASDVCVIIDDDADKHGSTIAGIPVVGAGALRSLEIGAVLVSSLAGEDAIVAKLEALAIPDLIVHPLYARHNPVLQKRIVYREHA